MSFELFSTLFFLSIFIKSNSLSFQDILLRKTIENNPDKNIMISPYSLYKMLSLLSNGAIGNTQKEILELLNPDKEIDESILEKINSNIFESITNIESENEINDSKCKVNLKDVNALFLRDYNNLKKEFKEICDYYNNSYFELVDIEQINNFCSENTEGKIDHIIDEMDGYYLGD